MKIKSACNPAVLMTPVTICPTSVGVSRILIGNQNSGDIVFVMIYDLPAAQVTVGVTSPIAVFPVEPQAAHDHVLPSYTFMQFDNAVTVAATLALDTPAAPNHPVSVTVQYAV